MNQELAAYLEFWRRHAGRILLALALALLGVLIFGTPAYRSRRQSIQVNAELDWLQEAVQRLQQAESPSNESGGVGGHPWVTPDHLIFSNGWAAYTIHSVHEGDGMSDIAMLKLSDGGFYLSKMHFCCGITDYMTRDREGDGPRPSTPNDFLENYAKRQEWNLYSPDGQLQCAVLGPDASHPRASKKTFWVWIGRANGTNAMTLLKKRFSVTGTYVAWTMRWLSGTKLVVDVFDYGPRSPMLHGPETNLPTNHITTLVFCEDQGTGKFSDKSRPDVR